MARRHGEAWRGVARRGEARRGEAWLGRRGAKIRPRCVEGGGVYPTLKGGTATKSTPLAWKILCVSRRVFRMCGRDLMC